MDRKALGRGYDNPTLSPAGTSQQVVQESLMNRAVLTVPFPWTQLQIYARRGDSPVPAVPIIKITTTIISPLNSVTSLRHTMRRFRHTVMNYYDMTSPSFVYQTGTYRSVAWMWLTNSTTVHYTVLLEDIVLPGISNRLMNVDLGIDFYTGDVTTNGITRTYTPGGAVGGTLDESPDPPEDLPVE